MAGVFHDYLLSTGFFSAGAEAGNAAEAVCSILLRSLAGSIVVMEQGGAPPVQKAMVIELTVSHVTPYVIRTDSPPGTGMPELQQRTTDGQTQDRRPA